MIVSHAHKFIYLRTEKTGSTALTAALAQYCGREENLKANLRTPISRHLPWISGGLQRRFPEVFGLHYHATAEQVRRILGPKVWDSYFKFAVERNPWERQISLFYHRRGRDGGVPGDFDRAQRSLTYNLLHHNRLNNWGVYAIGDEIVADQVIRYEDLNDALPGLFDRIGLPRDLVLPRRNFGHGGERQHYSSYYTPASRDLVASWYRREIEAFGFTFDDQGQPQTDNAGPAVAQPIQ
ncbi:sulfotransferase family 2 domain-containing protein [Sedimentimonas flavescens]|uniref:sulfotransferase family 2 domain-containing protein n=1 Tax=Sedimentimonas flavescens TaxID=2851012 RepID=UPI001C4A50EA|nr:sulfotransferase family 2 domain-containing protein [Sedimentimonas flavescens]MBW0156819.1 sulfotransferase family protein [Sedimentimonas flavescens]